MKKTTAFSENLLQARKAKGWSQEGAATTITIKRKLLSHYENGIREPSHVTLLKICKAYEVEDLRAFLYERNYHVGMLQNVATTSLPAEPA